MIRINWTSVSLVALVMTVASLTPPAASGQTSPGPGSPASSKDFATVVRLDAVALTRAIATELNRASVETGTPAASRLRLQQNAQTAGWIKRHPVLFGTAVGFATGFVIGCSPHEDNALYLFPGCFNGLYVGGIGAGIGAATAAIVRRF